MTKQPTPNTKLVEQEITTNEQSKNNRRFYRLILALILVVTVLTVGLSHESYLISKMGLENGPIIFLITLSLGLLGLSED